MGDISKHLHKTRVSKINNAKPPPYFACFSPSNDKQLKKIEVNSF
jgi:hypothetical protein